MFNNFSVLCCLCFLRWRQYLNLKYCCFSVNVFTTFTSGKWGETWSTRAMSCLNALITKIFGLICCFVNFSWAVYANAWSVKLISFIFNCCISSFWNYLFCFTVGVLRESGRNGGAILQKFWGGAHTGVCCHLPLMWSLFAGCCRILCWNSELGSIYGWTEEQMWHRQWKTPIRRSVLKVGAVFSLWSSAFITPFPPPVMVRLPYLSYFHLWQHGLDLSQWYDRIQKLLQKWKVSDLFYFPKPQGEVGSECSLSLPVWMTPLALLQRRRTWFWKE